MKRVLEGDAAAFAQLVDRYQKLVASAAWRYGVRRHEIEDLVSEVFLKVFKNLHQYRPDHLFSTWLYRLSANHVLDHMRRLRKERGRSEMPEQLADPAAGPDDGVEKTERAALVRACLDGLAERYRDVMFLVYLEGFSVDECSRTLGIPQGTVKSRLLRGREALRNALVRRHPEHFGS